MNFISYGISKGKKMIKELLRLANHLDAKGLRKEADYLDGIIGKIAGPYQDRTKDQTWAFSMQELLDENGKPTGGMRIEADFNIKFKPTTRFQHHSGDGAEYRDSAVGRLVRALFDEKYITMDEGYDHMKWKTTKLDMELHQICQKGLTEKCIDVGTSAADGKETTWFSYHKLKGKITIDGGTPVLDLSEPYVPQKGTF